jgi:multidrug efflux pump subunit AcrA (membrane-fusion protein)
MIEPFEHTAGTTAENRSAPIRSKTALVALLLLGSATAVLAQDATIATAENQVRSHTVPVAGRLEPRSRIVHSVPSAGFIDEIFVEEGGNVSLGTTLFTLRRRDDPLELYQPTPVLARIAGRVAEVSISSAEEVQSGESAVTIIGDTGYVLDAAISDKDAFLLEPGREVVGTTVDGTMFRGVFQSRSAEPDYETGLFTARFIVPQSAPVRIGAFVVFELPTDTVRGVFLPSSAIVRRFGRDTVWTVTNEDTLTAVQVELGAPFGDDVHVVSGISEGTRFLVAPSGREREGAAVPSRPPRDE